MNVYVVLSGQVYEDGIYHGHNIIGVYDNWNDAEAKVPSDQTKEPSSWECFEFVWTCEEEYYCTIIEEHNVINTLQSKLI